MTRGNGVARGMAAALVLVALYVAGTVWVGWGAVPIAAVLFGGAANPAVPRPGVVAALAGAAGWGAMLGVSALRGAPVAVAAHQFAELAQAPVWVLPLVTLAFPALLAACAAVVGAEVARVFTRKPAAERP